MRDNDQGRSFPGELVHTAKDAARTNWGLLLAGILLIAAGISMPAFLTVRNFGVYRSLEDALRTGENIHILLAALKLVILNTVRAVPHYLGAFFLAEVINSSGVRYRFGLSVLAVCLAVPGAYLIIKQIYGIRYDFGVPAVTLIGMLLVFTKIRFNFVNLVKKVLLMLLFITAIQFMDVMPALRGLPFGRGESSLDIKMVAGFTGTAPFLQGMAAICCTMLLLVSVLMLILILDENNIKRISEQKEQNERALLETQMRVMEDRTYVELKHLVHDLKSPLTSMQALVGLVKLSCENRGDLQEVGYLENVEGNIERISGMISEILYEDRLRAVDTGEIERSILAQTSAAEYAEMIQVKNLVPDAQVEVNLIRFSRALINLIENSFYAVDKESGRISLRIFGLEEQGSACVCFEVSDNGVGIARELLSQVWGEGFSTRNSHGLGLRFVQKVVEQSRGTITIASTPEVGTQVRILLPACGDKR